MLAQVASTSNSIDIPALVVALAALVTAVTTLLKVIGVGHRATEAVEANTKAIGDVHTLVNANLTAATVRNEQLTASLTEAGVAVPDPPAVIPPAVSPPEVAT